MAERTLLIATDGSPAGTAAVEAGLDLAAATRARVRFVHADTPVAEDLFDRHVDSGGPSSDQIVASDPVLADAQQRARAQGVEADVELITAGGGSADLAADIAGIAAGIDATMIVTGSRGRGMVAGAVLGSVSHNLIRYATVPVLIVHGPEHRPPDEGRP
jgi:nucleotide-binding universal stress UspA family protein